MSKAFTLDDIAFLTSDKAEKLLQKLTTEDLSDRNLINLIPKLRGTYSAEQTSAAIETVKLRRKALDKFGDDAAKMLFTQDALEQASDPKFSDL
ncbi:MAG: class I SAM-dependent methyltransferase, partial [Chloroflexota bacterium]